MLGSSAALPSASTLYTSVARELGAAPSMGVAYANGNVKDNASNNALEEETAIGIESFLIK